MSSDLLTDKGNLGVALGKDTVSMAYVHVYMHRGHFTQAHARACASWLQPNELGELDNCIDADALTGDESLAKAFAANAERYGDPDAQHADAEHKQAADQALTSLDNKTNVFYNKQELAGLERLSEAILPDTICSSRIAFAEGALTPDFECHVSEVSKTVLDEQIASAKVMRKMVAAVHNEAKRRADVAANVARALAKKIKMKAKMAASEVLALTAERENKEKQKVCTCMHA